MNCIQIGQIGNKFYHHGTCQAPDLFDGTTERPIHEMMMAPRKTHRAPAFRLTNAQGHEPLKVIVSTSSHQKLSQRGAVECDPKTVSLDGRLIIVGTIGNDLREEG